MDTISQNSESPITEGLKRQDATTMDKPCGYEIRVEGHLGDRWSDWFEGLEVHNEPNGETKLCGQLIDQAALMGVLTSIHALNLTLISVNRISSCEMNR